MRTDSEQQAAWTPGPWAVRDGTPEGGGQVWEITSPHAPDVNCNEVASSWENEPTARLIALAPEMAEAILKLQSSGFLDCEEDCMDRDVYDTRSPCEVCYRTDEWSLKAKALAFKLRRIGAGL